MLVWIVSPLADRHKGAVTDRQHKNKKTCGLHKEENMFFWYNLSMTSTQINQENYSVFQPYMLLDFTYSYEKMLISVICQEQLWRLWKGSI